MTEYRRPRRDVCGAPERSSSVARHRDEILAVNNKALHGLSHQEAINVFKHIKTGEVVLHVGRRISKRRREPCMRPQVA
ncbi:hypothetical protein J6590_022802 [Homalodisca vitripennis]|nr:hypothetical protein J6590_022802 [Homalodisca vitripennis]